MTKRVRTWTTKSGVVKTKTYTYDFNYARKTSKTVVEQKSKWVFKSGKLKKTAIDALVKQHGGLEADERWELERTAKRLLKSLEERDLPKDLLTGERIWASFTNDKLEGMLTNTGFTLEELAEMTNSTVSELLTESNWSANWTVFTNSKGEMYEFAYTYQATSTFTRIN